MLGKVKHAYGFPTHVYFAQGWFGVAGPLLAGACVCMCVCVCARVCVRVGVGVGVSLISMCVVVGVCV